MLAISLTSETDDHLDQQRTFVFVDVDTQRDFLDPSGALYVPHSDEIRPNLERLSAFAREHGIPVLATACAHHEGDAELAHFPAHCMMGTPGQNRIPETRCEDSVVLSNEARLDGPPPAHLTLEKQEIDLFSRSDADAIVTAYGPDAYFVVYGVATDFCVRAVVLGLLERRKAVCVVVDAVRAIDQERESHVLSELARQGALLTITDKVCQAPAA